MKLVPDRRYADPAKAADGPLKEMTSEKRAEG
jgi:hypothetical protein